MESAVLSCRKTTKNAGGGGNGVISNATTKPCPRLAVAITFFRSSGYMKLHIQAIDLLGWEMDNRRRKFDVLSRN